MQQLAEARLPNTLARRYDLCMKKMLLGLVFFVVAPATYAQSFRTFVASYGNDANDGSRAAPKHTFQSAHDAVSAGGQIVVLDSAGYGPFTITKSLTIVVPPGVNGF